MINVYFLKLQLQMSLMRPEMHNLQLEWCACKWCNCIKCVYGVLTLMLEFKGTGLKLRRYRLKGNSYVV